MAKTVKQVNDWTLITLESIDSTNAYAKEMIANGLIEKTVIISEVQTGGYGRSRKDWESFNNKGLWMSAVLPINIDVECLAQSTLVLAVAIQDAVHRVTDHNLQIKWPNDLLSNGKKCAGLLVELIPSKDDASGITTPDMMVLGVGLNVNQQLGDFSQTLQNIATSLQIITGQDIDKTELFSEIMSSIDSYFCNWQENGFSNIRQQWLDYSCSIGKDVKLPTGYEYTEGRVIGLTDTGALEVKVSNETIIEIDSGEVVFNI